MEEEKEKQRKTGQRDAVSWTQSGSALGSTSLQPEELPRGRFLEDE